MPEEDVMTDDDARSKLLPIGAVVDALQAEYPDVSHSSLRFLEREGLVVPARTSGGHRLYTAADVQRLRQIKAWQAQRCSLADIRARLTRLDELVNPHAPQELAARFLERVLAGDLTAARHTLLDASEAGLRLELLFDGVLRPALWALGEQWSRGEATVAQEKESSELARELITELVTRRLAGSLLPGNGQVVAACVAGEQHELGLRMVGGVLRARQIGVHYLGANVSTEFLLDAVRRRRPRAVLLSATLDEQLPALHDTLTALRETGLTVAVWAGGQAIERHPALVAEWGAAAALGGLGSVDELAIMLRAGAVE
jgi:DNA-binding transcriptional MerR regulator/methylmalonyl-CoA mutase cobalamin-binding subunit